MLVFLLCPYLLRGLNFLVLREGGVLMGLQKREARVSNADEGLLQNYTSI